VLYSKGNYPSDYDNKNKQEKSDERKVWYTGATRARKTFTFYYELTINITIQLDQII